jgi:SAM-dependent methyltransferase
MGLLLYITLCAAALTAPADDLRLSASDQYNQSMAWHSALPKGAKAASMETSGRLAELSLGELLPLLDLKPGMSVLDLGAGSGYYSVGIAKAVGPHGLVHASDTDPAMLELIASKAKAEHLDNLQTLAIPAIPGQADPYAGVRVDRVLLNSVLDVVPSPRELLAQAAALLKPEGLVVVVYPRIYPDFPGTEALPCQQALARVRELPDGSPLVAPLEAAGVSLHGSANCQPAAFARALNQMLADGGFFWAFSAFLRPHSTSPGQSLDLASTEDSRGVMAAASLQVEAGGGRPRPGVLRILNWYSLVSFLGLESKAWGYALGRGVYLPPEALVKLAATVGLSLVSSSDQIPRYQVLVLKKSEVGP